MGWAVSNWLIAGVEPEPLGNENMTASPSGTFKTGAGLLNIAANQQQQFEKLCELIDRKELAADPRFADRDERKRRRLELNVEIEKALAVKPAKEWAKIFNQNDVPAGAVLSIPEVLAHPQVQQRALVETFADAPGVGRSVAVVRGGFRVASGGPRPSKPPPILGADTETLLKELGYEDAAIAQLRASGAL
jgi:crotonobetainyl-CoA:carnitine CoA-transferase CaiB-like acyl-CoA transferase